jgi:hypothetical protein
LREGARSLPYSQDLEQAMRQSNSMANLLQPESWELIDDEVIEMDRRVAYCDRGELARKAVSDRRSQAGDRQRQRLAALLLESRPRQGGMRGVAEEAVAGSAGIIPDIIDADFDVRFRNSTSVRLANPASAAHPFPDYSGDFAANSKSHNQPGILQPISRPGAPLTLCDLFHAQSLHNALRAKIGE